MSDSKPGQPTMTALVTREIANALRSGGAAKASKIAVGTARLALHEANADLAGYRAEIVGVAAALAELSGEPSDVAGQRADATREAQSEMIQLCLQVDEARELHDLRNDEGSKQGWRAAAGWGVAIPTLVAIGLAVHEWRWASAKLTGIRPAAVIAIAGFLGIGVMLYFEITRPGDPRFRAMMLDRLLRDGVKHHHELVVELHLRAGRFKRGAAMAMGGAVVAVMEFTMFVFGPPQAHVATEVILATRIGGALALMFVVATIMTAYAGTLMLASRNEAVADLIRLGRLDEAAALLAKPIAFPSIVRPPTAESVRDAARERQTEMTTTSGGTPNAGDTRSS